MGRTRGWRPSCPDPGDSLLAEISQLGQARAATPPETLPRGMGTAGQEPSSLPSAGIPGRAPADASVPPPFLLPRPGPSPVSPSPGACARLSRLSRVRPSVTPWTAARQAPLSTGFSRREHRSGLPRPPPGDPGIEPRLSHLLHRQAGSLPLAPCGKPWGPSQVNQLHRILASAPLRWKPPEHVVTTPEGVPGPRPTPLRREGRAPRPPSRF